MARNRGVAAAVTPYIVFLDDDDAFAPGYLRALRDHWRGGGGGDYGYAGAAHDGADATAATFAPLPDQPSRSHLFPLSLGVWITRDAFDKVGGLRGELTTNEDTEFGINLVRHGLRGVIFGGAGVVINATRDNANDATSGQAASITKTEKTAVRAQCFARILDLHAPYLNTAAATVFRSFCIRRMLELSAKANAPFAIPDAIAGDLSTLQMLKWRSLYLANLGVRAVSGASKGS